MGLPLPARRAKTRPKISSIDGRLRYYAEVDYVTSPGQQPGWVALDLTLKSFSFVEKNYSSPMNEVAVLLSDADTSRVYPVRGAHPMQQPRRRHRRPPHRKTRTRSACT